MALWWQDPITQAHGVNGEEGVDLGTPFHTPLTAILGGTVRQVDCSPGWRCEIDIDTTFEGRPYVEGYLHVDQPAVSPGQTVAAGQLLGLSGGQLSGGSNPDVYPISTGPHVEFDMWEGNNPWSNPIDPTAVVQGGPEVGTGGPIVPGVGIQEAANAGVKATGVPSNPGPSLPGGLSLNFDPWSGFQQAIGGTASSFGQWVSSRAVPFGEANVIALVVAAAVLLVIFGAGRSSSGGSIVPVPV